MAKILQDYFVTSSTTFFKSCNKPGGSALPQPLLLGLLGLWPVLVHQLEQLGGCKQCGSDDYIQNFVVKNMTFLDVVTSVKEIGI